MKLSDRTWQGTLVGYEGDNGHIFTEWVPGRGVICSRDVDFDEQVFPGLPGTERASVERTGHGDSGPSQGSDPKRYDGLAARRGLVKRQMDVITVFLNGEIGPDTLIYVAHSTRYHEGGADQVCLLRKALYGLKQAHLLWFERLSSYVEGVLGLLSLHSDPCIFMNQGVIRELLA